ncbi:MAG: hypothetical protein ACYDCK_09760 [Thermoplasmatota archaeon]
MTIERSIPVSNATGKYMLAVSFDDHGSATDTVALSTCRNPHVVVPIDGPPGTRIGPVEASCS